MKGYEIVMAERGIVFRIGNQSFMIANTEVDDEDPESMDHRVFMADMLDRALTRLASGNVS